MKRILLIFVVLLLASPAWGTDRYIKCASGSNTTGDGTLSKPWKTIGYAMVSSRSNYGDMLLVDPEGGYCEDTTNGWVPAIGAGTGYITIQGLTDTARVDYRIKTTEGSRMRYIGADIHWKNIDFRGKGTGSAAFVWESTSIDGNELYTDCSFDQGLVPSAGSAQSFRMASDRNHTLTFIRPSITNVQYFITNPAGTGTHTFSFTTPLIDTYKGLIYNAVSTRAIDLTLHQGTLVRNSSMVINLAGANSTIDIKNNIVVLNRSTATAVQFLNVADGAAATLIAAPETWDVGGNIVYNTDCDPTTWVSDSGSPNYYVTQITSFENLIYDNSYILPIPATNYYLNPGFVSYGTGPSDANLRLTSTSMASGRGITASVPSGNDQDGNAWTAGGHVGAYLNPRITPLTIAPVTGRVVLGGDSLAYGIGSTSGNAAYDVLQTLAPTLDVRGGTYARAIPGLYSDGFFWLVDYIAINDQPEAIAFHIGSNDFTGLTFEDQILESVKSIPTKIASWGIRPLWIGVASTSGATMELINTDEHYNIARLVFNDAMETWCNTNGWAHDNLLRRIKFNSTWYNPDTYYACISGDLGCGVQNGHYNDNGHYLHGSIVYDLYYGKSFINLNDTTGTATGPATYHLPMTVAGFNALTSVPTGPAGRTVEVSANTTTPFYAPVEGTSTAPFLLKGQNYLKGGFNLKKYWRITNRARPVFR